MTSQNKQWLSENTQSRVSQYLNLLKNCWTMTNYWAALVYSQWNSVVIKVIFKLLFKFHEQQDWLCIFSLNLFREGSSDKMHLFPVNTNRLLLYWQHKAAINQLQTTFKVDDESSLKWHVTYGRRSIMQWFLRSTPAE